MTFTERPKVFAVGTGRRPGCLRVARRSRVIFMCWFLFLVAGINPIQSQSPHVAPATRKFEVPQEKDPFKREDIRRQARESTERYRVRVELPAAAFEKLSVDGSSEPGGESHVTKVPEFGPTDLITSMPKFVWLCVGVVVWYLIARKLGADNLRQYAPVMMTE